MKYSQFNLFSIIILMSGFCFVSFNKTFANTNLRACVSGLGDINKDGQFVLDPTYKNYQLFISADKVILQIGRDLSTEFYPTKNNPMLTKDNKKYYRFVNNPSSIDTVVWEAHYFIDEQIAKVYTIQRNGTNPWRVGTAFCPGAEK